MHVREVLRRPLMTEKTNIQADENNQYAFEVDRRANKLQVKDAVEASFDVTVEKVRVINMPARMEDAVAGLSSRSRHGKRLL